MAQVRLWVNPREGAIYDLPRVCMKCAAEATTVKKRTFSWYPQWVYLLLLAGLLPFVIVAVVLTKRQTVEIPFCDRHKNHFLLRVWAGLGGLAILCGAGGLFVFLLSANGPNNKNDDLAGVLCFGWSVLLLLYAVGVGVYGALTTIRPTRITDREVTLTNVSPKFARAVEEDDAEYERDIDRDVRDRRWRRRYDEDEGPDRGADRPSRRRSTDITEGDNE
jgi:hypothetical protein